MEVVAFCEIDPFCQAVLKKHWPHVPCYDDVTTLTGARLATDGIAVDLICGGFPCQDISVAGKGAGIGGERSGLWSEYARIIGELGPAYVIVENVSALLNRGMDVVLGDLAALGYDAEWHCIPASAVGAPHRRDRVWIIADARDEGSPCTRSDPQRREPIVESSNGHSETTLADATSERMERDRPAREQESFAPIGSRLFGRDGPGGRSNEWSIEPDVGRVAHGIPARVDRLRALGNAVVPQIPELIGRAIMAAEAQ
jgi:DNA (cytosine-5)-methyltransferase 1